MKLTTNKHKIIIIISVIFINAFANAQALICDTIPIWSDVKIILCREQHFLKFKNTDEQGGYFVTFYDTINKSTIVIKRLTWNLIPSKYAKDIITNKINACDTTIIFGTYLNTNTNATNNFKQKIYPSFEISYWDVTDSLKTTYDSIINSISIFQTKEPIDTIRYDQSGDTTYVQRNASDTHYRAHYGNYVKETGMPDKIYNEEGYIALHGDSVSYHFFERDYLGSVRAVFDLYGNLEQTNDYNVTGIPSSRHLGNADVHKHTGKEFQGFNGLAWYDNNARYYDPILARFTTQDPLAETTPWNSPYVHCSNNPLNRVDASGLADFVFDGKIIGSDNINDNRVLVIKTTKKNVKSGGVSTSAAHLNKKICNEMVEFIKKNSGNTEAFSNLILSDGSSIYDNVVEIESSDVNRSKMMEIVSADNGTGRGDDCNKEHGGYIKNGTVVKEPSGPTYNGGIDPISIPLTEGYPSFHSHPSTRKNVHLNLFSQVPSEEDLKIEGNHTHYVFSAYDKKVYIYNQNGVQAIIPLKRFVNLK